MYICILHSNYVLQFYYYFKAKDYDKQRTNKNSYCGVFVSYASE